MKNKLSFLLLISLMIVSSSYAQETPKKTKKITLQGVVIDRNKKPIVNASVFIDGENSGKVSNSKGLFKIRIKPDVKTITIFTTNQGGVEYGYRGEKKITFVLDTAFNVKQAPFKKKPSDEIVNTGYSSTKRRNLTTTTSHVNKKRINQSNSYITIFDMIKGEIPGVIVRGSSVRIRGTSTINGSSEPLYLVNGSPSFNISSISPSTVKSITVLKGPEAAIYGSRGANGVILIVLKSGNED